MDREMLSKYEAWSAKLQSNIQDMGRQRRVFRRMFVGAVVLSAIGFFWGVWLGVATFFTGIMVCGAGLYITMTREWEYERELKRTRAEVDRIRAEAPT
jgi:small basic protein